MNVEPTPDATAAAASAAVEPPPDTTAAAAWAAVEPPPDATAAAAWATWAAAAPPGATGLSWAERNWPRPPGLAPVSVIAGAAAAGLIAALSYVGQPPGAHVVLVTWLAAAVTIAAARGRRAFTRPSSVVLGVLTLALGLVPAIRDAPWLSALCLIAAVGIGVLLAVDGRSWFSGVLALPVLAAATVRGLPWLRGRLRHDRLARRGAGWWRGGAIGLVVIVVLGALLASADAVFGRVVGSVLPDLRVDDILGRLVILVLVAITVVGLGYCAASPPRWERLSVTPGRGPAAEWALPLALAVVALGCFVAVQIVALADPGLGLAGTGLTPAERARQGFGQLVWVTVLTALVLAWAGRRADPANARHRWLMIGLGGPLSLLLLAIVATAVARMAAYEDAFGATVMRLLVAAFEIWLGALVVLVALAWVSRRLPVLPRAAVASAALVLLALAAINPEGVVAERNIDRYRAGDPLDTRYLARLSDDAVPAIAQLDGDELRCALGRRQTTDAAWYAYNLGRDRAQPVLAGHDKVFDTEVSMDRDPPGPICSFGSR